MRRPQARRPARRQVAANQILRVPAFGQGRVEDDSDRQHRRRHDGEQQRILGPDERREYADQTDQIKGGEEDNDRLDAGKLSIRTALGGVGFVAGADEDVTDRSGRPQHLLEQALPQKLPPPHREVVAMAAAPHLLPVGVALRIVDELMMG